MGDRVNFRCGRSKLYIAIILLLSLLLGAVPLTTFAQEEKKQVIRIGCFPYEDYMQADAKGNYSGYGYDYLQEIARYTGWQYEIVDGSWSDCLKKLDQGEIDLMGAVMRSKEREAIYDFSDYSMISGYGVLVTNLDNQALPFEDFSSFNGLPVGALKGNLQEDHFIQYSREHGFTPVLREYDSQAAMDAALEAGEISAFVTTNTLHASSLRIVATFGATDAYFATTKGNTAVLTALNEAMRKIRLSDPYFNSKLDEKYYQLQSTTAISFTKEELNFIQNSPAIPCVYIPAAPPISYYDEAEGGVQGISVDVCQELEKITGLTFQWITPKSATEAADMLHRGEALLIPAKYYDYNWAEQNNVLLTDPYLSGQMVMVTNGRNTGAEIVALYDQGSQSQIVANRISYGVQLKQYATIIDCMNAVLSGEATTTFINSTIASYLVNNPKYAGLQTSPLDSYSANVAMAVSSKADPLLLSVLNKGLRSISHSDMNQIVLSQMKKGQASPMANYLYLHPVETIVLVAGILLAMILLLLILFYIRLKNNRKMRKTLYTDALTGHPNYRALAKESVKLVAQYPGQYALIYLDIYRFKVINDTFGYEIGDQVLIATSKTLQNFLLPEERFARIYADTFVLLLKYNTQEQLRLRLDRLSIHLGKISTESPDAITPLFSGGVYLLPKDFDHLDKACDRANYAKDSISHLYSTTFVFYDDVMRSRVLAEKELETSMLRALERGEFIPYYQPKVNAITEKVVGAEALVRWQHPEKGLIPPNEFLPFYEKNGFIVKIDLYIFEQVCKSIQEWLQDGNQAVPVSVNFSRRHIQNSQLPEKLKEICARYHVPTSLLEIEVTETEELANMDTAVGFVNALKANGFDVSIDDYGTGYSSISFLQQLPLDALKLDRDFILNAMKTGKARDVMQYLVASMQKNEIRILCEGIETKEQRDFVISLNCRFIQGYLYSTPLPREAFEAYLLQHGVDTSDRLDFIPVTNFNKKSRWAGAQDFLTKAMPSWIVSCLLDSGYPIHFISPSFLEGMGYSELEFGTATGGLFTNWVHPDDLQQCLRQLEKCKLSIQSQSMQYRLRKKDGSYLWIQEINKRVMTDDGQEVLLKVCTDVTNLVALQLDKSHLMDAIPGGVGTLRLTAEGPIIKQATERFYGILGYTQEEMEARQNNLMRILYAPDLPCAMESMRQALETNQSGCECNFRVQLQDGSLHWTYFKGSIARQSEPEVTVIIYNNDEEMQAKEAGEISRAKLELALTLTQHAIFEYDIQTKIVYSHNGFSKYGIPEGVAINMNRDMIDNGFIHPEDAEKLHKVQLQLSSGEEHASYEIRVRSKNSSSDPAYSWVRVTLTTIFSEDKQPVRAVGVVEDINQQKRFEYAFQQESQYRKAFTESSLMAYEINLTKDSMGRLTGSRGFRLQELCQRLPHPDCYSEILVASTKFLVAEEDREIFVTELSREHLMQLYQDGICEKELEYRRLTLDGEELWNSVLIYLLLDQLSGDVMGYAYHRDIHERKTAEKELVIQAARDPLTGVLNRSTAEQLIHNFLLRQANPNRIQAFLMLDLDQFKKMNDTYGHIMGDKYLMALTKIVTNLVRTDDIVARMGGDEFAILLKNLPNEQKAVSIAQSLARAVAEIGKKLEVDLKTSVSIGIATTQMGSRNFESLYRHADQAMYEAKKQPEPHVVIYQEP